MTSQCFDSPKPQSSVDHTDEMRIQANTPMISIVIPAKNEEKCLQSIVERTQKSLFDSRLPFEILLVDDGSLDSTFTVSTRMAADDSRVVVLKNHANSGKGFSLRKGFRKARGDFVVTMDADGQHMPEEIPKLIEPILKGEADIVLGSRFLENDNGIPFRHWLGNKVVTSCFNTLFRSRFRDVLLGLRAFRKDTLAELKLDFNGYLTEVELLAAAVRKNVPIVEVQINCKYPKRSSLFRGSSIVGRIIPALFLIKIKCWKANRCCIGVH